MATDNPDELPDADALAAAARADLSALSYEELLERSVAMYVQHQQFVARLAALEKKLDQGDPPPWVKPNAPPRSQKAAKEQNRKRRPHAFSRKRLEPTDTVYHVLDSCPDCHRTLKDGWVHRIRQVIDLPPVKAKVTDHIVLGRHCGVCGKNWVPKIDLSKEVVGKHSIGVGLMSLIGHLQGVCRLPIRTIRSLLETLYGLKISVGAIVEALNTIADRGTETLRLMLDHIRGSPVKHADETGWREDGQNGYLWSFSTPTVRYLVYNRSRASAVPEDVLGEDVKGTLVCDFYGAYNSARCLTQRCWTHLLRALHELKVAHPEDNSVLTWADSVIALYRRAAEYQAACKAAPYADAHSILARRDQRRAFESQLSWLATPYLELPKEGRPPQTVLAERCEKYAAELFVFVEFLDVPSGNNAAERSVRPCVIARKISGGTRSAKGSTTRAALMSLFGTWQLQKRNPWLECKDMLIASQPATNAS